MHMRAGPHARMLPCTYAFRCSCMSFHTLHRPYGGGVGLRFRHADLGGLWRECFFFLSFSFQGNDKHSQLSSMMLACRSKCSLCKTGAWLRTRVGGIAVARSRNGRKETLVPQAKQKKKQMPFEVVDEEAEASDTLYEYMHESSSRSDADSDVPDTSSDSSAPENNTSRTLDESASPDEEESDDTHAELYPSTVEQMQYEHEHAEELHVPVQAPADEVVNKLQISKNDFTVSSLIDKISRGKVNLAPRYQREYVWTVGTASKLVESLLMGVPVPTVFFCESTDGTLDVVDGKQRISSLYAFMCNSFPDGTPFRLKGLEILDLNGKTFDELSETQREAIRDYPLSANTLSRNTDIQHVYEVFERLNMGSTSLNEMELRNAVFCADGRSKNVGYAELLARLVQNPIFLAINRQEKPHPRQTDRELILRFFSLQRVGPGGMYTPLKRLLNDEMRRGMNMSKQEWNRRTKLWNKVMNLADSIFGTACAFSRPASGAASMPEPEDTSSTERFQNEAINNAVFDTLAYSLAMMDEKKASKPNARKMVLDAFIAVFDTKQMRENLRTGKKEIMFRHERWMHALHEEEKARGLDIFLSR